MMWQPQIVDDTTRAPLGTVPTDYGKWVLRIGYGLVAAAILAGLAFGAGYLTALHGLARIVHHDNAALVHLRLQNQFLHQKLAPGH